MEFHSVSSFVLFERQPLILPFGLPKDLVMCLCSGFPCFGTFPPVPMAMVWWCFATMAGPRPWRCARIPNAQPWGSLALFQKILAIDHRELAVVLPACKRETNRRYRRVFGPESFASGTKTEPSLNYPKPIRKHHHQAISIIDKARCLIDLCAKKH